jgi:hypothetical protein
MIEGFLALVGSGTIYFPWPGKSSQRIFKLFHYTPPSALAVADPFGILICC